MVEQEEYSSLDKEDTSEHNYRTGSRTQAQSEEQSEEDYGQFSQEKRYKEIDFTVELEEYNFQQTSLVYGRRLYNSSNNNVTYSPEISVFKMPGRSRIYVYGSVETMVLAYFVAGILIGTILFLICVILRHAINAICHRAGRKSDCEANITHVLHNGISHRRLSNQSSDIAVRTTASRVFNSCQSLVSADSKDLPPSYSTCLRLEEELPPYSALLDGALPYSGYLPDSLGHRASDLSHE